MSIHTIPTGTAGQPPLALRPAKIVPLPAPPAIPKADQAALLAACPHPYRVTLAACLELGYRTGRLWARHETLEDRTGLTWRTVKRHRAWLVDNAYLRPAGGGHRGRVASYIILGPEDRSVALRHLRDEKRSDGEAVEVPALFDWTALRGAIPARRAR